jgi:hypothetical protein
MLIVDEVRVPSGDSETGGSVRVATIAVCLVCVLLLGGCSRAAAAPDPEQRSAAAAPAAVRDVMTFLSYDPATVPGRLVRDRVGDYPPDIERAEYAEDGIAIYYTATYYVEEDVYLSRVYRIADIGAEPELLVADAENWSAAERAKADRGLVDYMRGFDESDIGDSTMIEPVNELSLSDGPGTGMTLKGTDGDGPAILELIDASGDRTEVFRDPGIKYGRTTFANMVADPEGFVVFSVLFEDDILTWERLYRLDVARRVVVPLGSVHIEGWDYSPVRNAIAFNTTADDDVSRVAEFPVPTLQAAAVVRPMPGPAEATADAPDPAARATNTPAPVADAALWLRSDRAAILGPPLGFDVRDLGSVGFLEYAADQRGIFYFTDAREGWERFVERIHFAKDLSTLPSVITTQTGTLVSTRMAGADPGLRALVRRWEGPITSALWAMSASGKRVGLAAYNDADGSCQLDVVDTDGTHTAILVRSAYRTDPARITRLAVDEEGFVIVGVEWPEDMMAAVADIDADDYEGPPESWRGVEYVYRLDLDTRVITPIGKVPVDGWAYSARRNTIAFYLEAKDGANVRLAEYRLP